MQYRSCNIKSPCTNINNVEVIKIRGRLKVENQIESIECRKYSREFRTSVKPLRANISIKNAIYPANLGAK